MQGAAAAASYLTSRNPPWPQISYMGVTTTDVERMLHRLRSHWGHLPPTIFIMMMKSNSEDLPGEQFPGCVYDCECVRHPSRCSMPRCVQRYR
jgi:hypothetical protein